MSVFRLKLHTYQRHLHPVSNTNFTFALSSPPVISTSVIFILKWTPEKLSAPWASNMNDLSKIDAPVCPTLLCNHLTEKKWDGKCRPPPALPLFLHFTCVVASLFWVKEALIDWGCHFLRGPLALHISPFLHHPNENTGEKPGLQLISTPRAQRYLYPSHCILWLGH